MKQIQTAVPARSDATLMLVAMGFFQVQDMGVYAS